MAHPKGVLIERLQKAGQARPEFRSERTGPDHQPTFLSDVLVDGQVLGTGQGGSKREAERRAAEEALGALEQGGPAPVENGGADEPYGDQPYADEMDDAEPYADDAELPFEGPWPVFESVLAGALQVADRRIPDHLRGDEARLAVRDFALALYKDVLQDLGDVVEEEDEES
ncbi:MAG TPA: putative dsRNA-binding protein [Trueperaceae bacterium]|nr:putative dsRNA-binding protein [Trueperaceae bacterium]